VACSRRCFRTSANREPRRSWSWTASLFSFSAAVGPDEFIFAGTGLVVTFEANPPAETIVGILSVQEGEYVRGQWTPGRWLNGDQTHQGRHLRLEPGRFGIQRIKLYRYG